MENIKLFELAERYHKLFPKHDMIATKTSGKMRTYSSSEYIETTNNIGYGLLNLGINKNDKICIISLNRPEWSLIDMGINKIGAVNVGIYANITRAEYKYIINDCGAKIIFVGSNEIYNTIKGLDLEIECLEHIFSFDQIEGVNNWLDIVENGVINPQEEQMNKIQKQIIPQDLFTLIYTSGTTGKPKGVMLNHSNVISQITTLKEKLPIGINDRAISFLPLCHVFERMIEYFYMFKGVSIYYAQSLETLGEDLKEIQPTIMPTVPRLLEKVYDKILTKGSELKGLKKKLFFWAVELGLKHEYNGKNGIWYEFQLAIANKIIFNKWREAVGGNIRFIVSGASALQERIAKIFTAAQMPVLEGYGLSETSPVISVNLAHTKNAHYGTVGTVIPGVELKLVHEEGMREGEGEITIKGPNVMMGYYNKPEETKKVIDKDGWFHTGDIGCLIKGKYLKITDRKKEIFKTSGGKYIAPQVMENRFKESRLIEQIIVIGEGEKHPAALIMPSEEGIKFWCHKHNINFLNMKEVINKKAILEKFNKEIEKYNNFFNPYERIKKFELISEPWSVDGGELTATMKLRRKNILAKYQHLYKKIYNTES
ncbi:MAG: long-chain fatty acid--CoA ligase [Flavobacteriales bacterium]|nr:long-chain fatty acid--CoA ligase [Flavobacteriales bacterium]